MPELESSISAVEEVNSFMTAMFPLLGAIFLLGVSGMGLKFAFSRIMLPWRDDEDVEVLTAEEKRKITQVVEHEAARRRALTSIEQKPVLTIWDEFTEQLSSSPSSTRSALHKLKNMYKKVDAKKITQVEDEYTYEVILEDFIPTLMKKYLANSAEERTSVSRATVLFCAQMNLLTEAVQKIVKAQARQALEDLEVNNNFLEQKFKEPQPMLVLAKTEAPKRKNFFF